MMMVMVPPARPRSWLRWWRWRVMLSAWLPD